MELDDHRQKQIIIINNKTNQIYSIEIQNVELLLTNDHR